MNTPPTPKGDMTMRVCRNNIEEMVSLAKEVAKNNNHEQFVFASAIGFHIEDHKPGFNQAFIKVMPNGDFSTHDYDFQNGKWIIKHYPLIQEVA